MKALDLLQRHNIPYNILATVTDFSARYPHEIYSFFKSIGATYLQFSPVVERIHPTTKKLLPPTEQEGQLAPWSVSAEAYGTFLCQLFDDWVKEDVGEVFVTTFDATLAGYVGVQPGVCLFSATCGHAAALESNGDLYACDHFVFPAYRLGNLQENPSPK
jgi:uncharacterized protein